MLGGSGSTSGSAASAGTPHAAPCRPCRPPPGFRSAGVPTSDQYAATAASRSTSPVDAAPSATWIAARSTRSPAIRFASTNAARPSRRARASSCGWPTADATTRPAAARAFTSAAHADGSEGQPPAPVESAPDRSRRAPPGSPHRDRPPRPPAHRSTRTTRHPGAPLCPRPEDPRGSRREPSSDTATATYRPTPSMDRLWRRRRRRDVLRQFAFGDQTVLRRTPRRPPPAGPLPPAISPHRAVPLARPPWSPGASGTPNTSRSTRSRRAPRVSSRRSGQNGGRRRISTRCERWIGRHHTEAGAHRFQRDRLPAETQTEARPGEIDQLPAQRHGRHSPLPTYKAKPRAARMLCRSVSRSTLRLVYLDHHAPRIGRRLPEARTREPRLEIHEPIRRRPPLRDPMPRRRLCRVHSCRGPDHRQLHRQETPRRPVPAGTRSRRPRRPSRQDDRPASSRPTGAAVPVRGRTWTPAPSPRPRPNLREKPPKYTDHAIILTTPTALPSPSRQSAGLSVSASIG